MGFFLWQLGPDVPEVPDARASGIEYLGTGLVFVLLGTGLVSWAGFHYLRTLDSIERGRFDPARRSIITIAIVVAMAGCVIAGLVIMGSLMRTGNRS
jgi:uncharacterized membrane protein YidH (DUF202 family)